MTYRYGRPRDSLTPTEKCETAVQAIGVIEELIDELNGMVTYLALVRRILRAELPEHRRLMRYVSQVEKNSWDYQKRFGRLCREYEQYVADYQHRNGPIDLARLKRISDFSMSFEELVGQFGTDRVLKDFFDE